MVGLKFQSSATMQELTLFCSLKGLNDLVESVMGSWQLTLWNNWYTSWFVRVIHEASTDMKSSHFQIWCYHRLGAGCAYGPWIFLASLFSVPMPPRLDGGFSRFFPSYARSPDTAEMLRLWKSTKWQVSLTKTSGPLRTFLHSQNEALRDLLLKQVREKNILFRAAPTVTSYYYIFVPSSEVFYERPPPWHHIITYFLSQVLTFFMLKSARTRRRG